MAFGWEGNLVRLVPLDKSKHLENYVRWVNDPNVTDGLLIGDFPMTRLAEEEWFDQASKESRTDVVFAIETLDGQHIGTSGIHQISFKNGTCITGTFIGTPELWGMGYGTDAAFVRARYIFEVLGLRMIYSGYLEGNERSKRMSEKVGLKECGRFPQKFWKRGRYRDEILMCLSREDWLKQQSE